MNFWIIKLGESLSSVLMLLAFLVPVMIPAGFVAAESEVSVEDVEECVLERESDRKKQKRVPGFFLRFPEKPASVEASHLKSDFSVELNGHRIVHDLLAPLAC
jgi:hypothetical protein